MRRLLLVIPMAFVLIATACTSSGNNGGGTSSGGVTNLVMWMGYTPPPPENTAFEYNSVKALVAEFNKTHPDINVSLRYVNSDYALTKATAALQGNDAPDISYQYGTNMPQLAEAPGIVDLTQRVNQDGYNWNDFYQGERAVATVDGRVLGVPALVDNLAVVYNKDLFAKNHVPTPSPNWTWDDLRSAAKAVSDPANKVFGLAFPTDGSETTVWEYEAMLWEAGGDILTPDNKKAIFNSAQGTQALTMLQSIQKDGSMYMDFHPDAGKSEELFNSGKIGMIITGPWDLSAFPNVNYGVQFMPSFAPGGSHETIAGPDNWVIFNNGTQHVNASWEFLKWFTSPPAVLQDSLATGHLPTRQSVEQSPKFKPFATKYPGAGTFAQNLVNVTKARPQVPQYPQVSKAIGQAVVTVLLGKAQPQDALNSAANQADGALAAPA